MREFAMFNLPKILTKEVNLIAGNNTDHAQINQFQNISDQQIRIFQLYLRNMVIVILLVFLIVE